MVAPAGKALRAHQLRPLNLPRPTRVLADKDGLPRWVERARVAALCDEWRVEDAWWREEVRRRYFRVLLADGRRVTLYQDRVSGGWYRQSY